MLQILKAVEYMHKSGYFHKDLKPENQLVTKDVIKEANLRLATQIKPFGHSYDKNIGSAWYKALEVLLHDSYYGASFDMWAIGIIMVEFFILQPLFQGNNILHHLELLCVVFGSPIEQTWPDGIKLASSYDF